MSKHRNKKFSWVTEALLVALAVPVALLVVVIPASILLFAAVAHSWVAFGLFCLVVGAFSTLAARTEGL
jgi:hypothetical protein